MVCPIQDDVFVTIASSVFSYLKGQLKVSEGAVANRVSATVQSADTGNPRIVVFEHQNKIE